MSNSASPPSARGQRQRCGVDRLPSRRKPAAPLASRQIWELGVASRRVARPMRAGNWEAMQHWHYRLSQGSRARLIPAGMLCAPYPRCWRAWPRRHASNSPPPRSCCWLGWWPMACEIE
ncbi:hypothetical protein BDV95DRAFT_584072 [Massariosphaeria phaeospora]|uniref:Uncharacterized protein n=1 Tax=Massariosphaeria phaeospora TaxID=100035 RepID=A0A7C8MD92_9PLEO|nr:hypothetical protein BDV95DRAFT_584072 [Massariosphaeria phaeospora]